MKTSLFTILACLFMNSAHAQPINRLDVVKAVKERISSTIDVNHGPGECGRFEITKRVAWELRLEGAGFLTKTGAQNKCNEQNTTDAPGYGIDVIMYQDGTLIDILGSGSEGPNTPQWMVFSSPAPISSWRAPFDPGDSSPPSPPSPQHPVPPDLTPRLQALEQANVELEEVILRLITRIDGLEAQATALYERILKVESKSIPISCSARVNVGAFKIPISCRLVF